VASQVDPGLCATCTHVAVVRSDRGSVFFRCKLSEVDARFRKYPALPVLKCDGWVRNPHPQLDDPEKESQV
jgi:hypothetical protein